MPLLPIIGAFALGNALKRKSPKKQAVSSYKKKNGTRVKAYTRKGKRSVKFI